MKYKNKLARLAKRQKSFDNLDNKKGRKKPGSIKKTA